MIVSDKKTVAQKISYIFNICAESNQRSEAVEAERDSGGTESMDSEYMGQHID